MRRLILMGILGLAMPAFTASATQSEIEGAMSDDAASASATDERAMAVEPEPAAMPETTAMTEPEPAEPVLSPVSADAVARGTFTTGVEQREPVDSIDSLASDHARVYYFTEFVGLEGRRLTHLWMFRDEVVAEVPITIGGPRWRAYSSKELDASRLGEWTVTVVDESGRAVRTDTFVYEAFTPAPEIAAPTEAPPSMPDAPAAPAAGMDAPAADMGAPAAPAPGDALE